MSKRAIRNTAAFIWGLLFAIALVGWMNDAQAGEVYVSAFHANDTVDCDNRCSPSIRPEPDSDGGGLIGYRMETLPLGVEVFSTGFGHGGNLNLEVPIGKLFYFDSYISVGAGGLTDNALVDIGGREFEDDEFEPYWYGQLRIGPVFGRLNRYKTTHTRLGERSTYERESVWVGLQYSF